MLRYLLAVTLLAGLLAVFTSRPADPMPPGEDRTAAEPKQSMANGVGVEITASVTEGTLPLEVEFTSKLIGENAEIAEVSGFEWSFGDGESESGETVEHTYTEAGRYRVSLTLTIEVNGSLSVLNQPMQDQIVVTEEPTVDETIRVPAGETLEIGPGEAYVFAERTSLIVEGTLRVAGTEEEPVSLRGNRWLGIELVGTAARATIEHAVITGVYSFEGAGVRIYNGGDATIAHTRFEGCRGNAGGAIQLRNPAAARLSQLVVRDCVFEDCGARDGAAIFAVDRATVTVEDSRFVGNAADNRGGAIFAVGIAEEPMELTIRGSEFRDNRANTGGAVEANWHTAATIADCRFTNNRGANNGGAIILLGEPSLPTTLTMTDCMFTGNQSGADGGALNACLHSQAKLTSCQFTGNESSGFGGGIMSIATNEHRNQLSVSACEFTNNEAAKGGGVAIYRGNDFTMTDSEFSGNQGADVGGALYLMGSEAEQTNAAITGTTFASNQSTTGAGGAVHVNSYVAVAFQDCTLSENTASDGGALYVVSQPASPSRVSMEACEVSNNVATDEGGGININYYAAVSLDTVTLTGNRAGTVGGAVTVVGGVMSNRSMLSVADCTFTENAAGANGGAIAANRNSATTVASSTFEKNSAAEKGGAIYLDGEVSDTDEPTNRFTLDESSFDENEAEDGGADLYAAGQVELDERSLRRNGLRDRRRYEIE